jgi:hypothetical protein
VGWLALVLALAAVAATAGAASMLSTAKEAMRLRFMLVSLHWQLSSDLSRARS